MDADGHYILEPGKPARFTVEIAVPGRFFGSTTRAARPQPSMNSAQAAALVALGAPWAVSKMTLL